MLGAAGCALLAHYPTVTLRKYSRTRNTHLNERL